MTAKNIYSAVTRKIQKSKQYLEAINWTNEDDVMYLIANGDEHRACYQTGYIVALEEIKAMFERMYR